MTFVGVMVVADNVDSGPVVCEVFERASATGSIVRAGGEKCRGRLAAAEQGGSSGGSPYWLMVAEMFNERVDAVHRVGPRTYWENVLPTVSAHELAGALVPGRLAGDRAVRAGDVPRARRREAIASSPYGALQLIEAQAPFRLSPSSACPRTR